MQSAIIARGVEHVMSVSVEDFKTYLLSGNTNAPKSIQRFDYASKISVGLSIFGFLISLFGHPMMMMAGGGGAIVGLVLLALYIFVLYMIVMQAKSWAKWIFVVLYAVGLIGFIMSLQFMFMFGIVAGLINLVQYGLGAYASILLFQKESTAFLR